MIVENPKIISTQRHQLAEGPFWCGSTRALYWVDIPACELWRWSSSTDQVTHWKFQKQVSGVFTTDVGDQMSDTLLVVLKDEVVLFDTRTQTSQQLCELDTDLPDNRSNDAKIAPDGSLWVGTMDNLQKQKSGRLWRITPDGEKQLMLDNIGISNTLAWDTDRGVFYFADSVAGSIYRFPYPAFKDTRSSTRAFVTLEGNSVPDGSSIDSAGYLWNAQWDGSRVVRYSPDGEIDLTLELPMQKPTSCCFGGVDGKTLFITSASVGLSATELDEQPLAGQVIAVDLDQYGSPGQSFSC